MHLIKTNISHILIYSIPILFILSIIIFFNYINCCFSLFGECADTTITTLESPNKELKATLFERDCGATTATSIHIEIIHNDEIVKVFTARSFKDKIDITWENDALLRIDYNDLLNEIFLFEPLASNIQIKIFQSDMDQSNKITEMLSE